MTLLPALPNSFAIKAPAKPEPTIATSHIYVRFRRPWSGSLENSLTVREVGCSVGGRVQ